MKITGERDAIETGESISLDKLFYLFTFSLDVRDYTHAIFLR